MPINYGINQVEVSGGDTWMPLADVQRTMAGIRDIGAKRIRILACWQFLETAPGVYKLGPNDPLTRSLQLAAQYGLTPLLVMSSPTPWFGSSAASYGNLAKAIARAYGPQGLNLCDHYEVWNEANSAAYFPGTPPSPNVYTGYLKSAYLGIKEVHPTSTVITVGVTDVLGSFFTTDCYYFIKGIYDSGGQNYMDAVGFHWYSRNDKFETQ